jgi:Ca-activated chloride channel family protein
VKNTRLSPASPAASGLVLLAAALCLLAAGARAQQRQPPATFRSGIDVVSLGVTAFDKKGNFLTDLRPEDVEVYEDGRKQALRFFIPCAAQATDGGGNGGVEAPLHLGALFDISGSMEEDLSFARSAAIKFLNSLSEAHDFTLVDFDTEVRVARFSQAEFPRLVERIRSRKADGFTALWDAIGVYLDGASMQEGRKILVLYTDGGDNASNINFNELTDLLKASDVTVHAIGFLQHQPASAQLDQRMRLQRIAEYTGGQVFFPGTTKDLEGVYQKVAAEIDAQYTLGYLSANPKQDGTWRKVEIKLVRSGLKDVKVRARLGYFAPLKDVRPVK